MRHTKAKRKDCRYAIYLRCSTDDQAQKDFTTIDAQRELDEIHVRSLGGSVVREYADEGKSGTNLERPGWKAMLDAADRKEFDAVCVTYMSRLGRGEMYTIAQYELSKRHIFVEMVKEKFADDLAGYMTKTMTTMMDGFYPKMVGQWTRTKMERMVERGYHCGGITPFGYKTETVTDAAGFHAPGKEPPKRLVPDEEKAPLVRNAYNMATHRAGMNQIARYLTATSGRRWYSTIVKHLLTSETYKGIQVFGDWRNDRAHEAIIDAETWQTVQEILEERDIRMFTRDRNEYTYLFRGLVWCPYCKCQYTTRSAHGRNGIFHYYSCQHADKNAKCPVGRVNADKLHEVVFEQIRIAVENPAAMKAMYDEYAKNWDPELLPEEGEYDLLMKRREALEFQTVNLTRAIAGGQALASLIAALEKTEKDISDIDKRMGEIIGAIKATKLVKPTIEQMQVSWKEFLESWKETPEELKEKAAHLFIRRITVTNKRRAEIEVESVPISARELVRLSEQHGSPLLAKANQLQYFPIGYVVDMPDIREQSDLHDFFPHPAFA